MAGIADRREELNLRISEFLDREVAKIKAGEEPTSPTVAWMRVTKAAFHAASSMDTLKLPLLPMFLGQGEAVKDAYPLAEPDYLFRSPSLDDQDESRRRMIQNIFDYQVSLVHAPAGTGPIPAIVAAAEAILAKSPQTKILVCGHTDTAADKIADEFFFREFEESLSDPRLQHLRLGSKRVDSLDNFKVIICTYSNSCMDKLKGIWTPHVLIAVDASRLTCYELLTPITTHFDSLTRLVLLGDHLQPGPNAEPEPSADPLKDESEGNKTVFKKLMEEQWPSCMLEVDSVTHSDLCFPRSSVFYREKVTAIRQTSKPGSFLPHLLQKLAAEPRITVAGSKATAITSFAHFFDIRGKANVSDEPVVNFVDALVRRLLSTDACQTSQIMVVSGGGSCGRILAEKASCGGWNEVAVHTISSAQGLSTKVAIFCLPRNVHDLELSPMSRSRSACIIMSLATDVCYFVGQWRAVCELPHTNDLQRSTFCMDETILNFLVRVEASSYTRDEPAVVEDGDG